MIRKFHVPRTTLKALRKAIFLLLILEGALQMIVLISFLYREASVLYRRYEAKQNNWFIREPQQSWWDEESRQLREHTRYHPFLGFLTSDVSTSHITIDAKGARNTIGNPGTDRSLRSIFLFGGSTMVGYYAKDSETIASYVAEDLNKRTPRVVVTNFGQTAFVNSQELLYLMLQLKEGNRPDMVVFYDGCNELSLATSEDPRRRIFYETTLASGRDTFDFFASPPPENHTLFSTTFFQNIVNRIATVRLIGKIRSFVQSALRSTPSAPVDQAADRASRVQRLVATYVENASVIDKLATSYGFSYALLWQPMSFTKPLTAQEKKTFVVGPDVYESMKDIYLTATKQLTALNNPHFYDLTEEFSHEAGRSIFIDSCHITPEGNRLIAGKISSIIRQVFGWQE